MRSKNPGVAAPPKTAPNSSRSKMKFPRPAPRTKFKRNFFRGVSRGHRHHGTCLPTARSAVGGRRPRRRGAMLPRPVVRSENSRPRPAGLRSVARAGGTRLLFKNKKNDYRPEGPSDSSSNACSHVSRCKRGKQKGDGPNPGGAPWVITAGSVDPRGGKASNTIKGTVSGNRCAPGQAGDLGKQ